MLFTYEVRVDEVHCMTSVLQEHDDMAILVSSLVISYSSRRDCTNFLLVLQYICSFNTSYCRS